MSSSEMFPGSKMIPTAADRYDDGHAQPVTLDEYIAQLQALQKEYGGDLLVQKWQPSKGRHNAPRPKIAHEVVYEFSAGGKVKTALRIPQFWDGRYDPENKRGARVVRI